MHPKRLAVFLATLALATTACGSSKGAARGPTTTAEKPADGGTLVIRTAGEPGCMDFMAPCSAGFGAPVRNLLLPQTVVFVGGKYVPTPLLAGEPVQDYGPPHRLTYHLNPKAVWSDGVPITSSDFTYTWTEHVTAPSIRNRTGFEQIDSIDDSDPKTVVITFKQPYAAWFNPFGTLQSVFPKHLLEGKDRTALTKDGFTWSGTPWKLDRWVKGEEIRFVPNPNYWGPKPHLDALVYKVIPDNGAALAAYKSGQVSLLQAVPPEVSLGELQTLPNTAVSVELNLVVNGLTINVAKPPLDSVAVRQALAYATDRQALVAQAVGLLKPDAKPIQSMMTPVNGHWYIEPFARYRRDLARVDQLMSGAGWARGPDGIWAKGSQRAEIDLVGQAGNKPIELQEQVLQSQWKEAGFATTIDNATNLTEIGQKGAFNVVFAGGTFTNDDPSRCALLCSRNIPTPENGFSGQNFSRIADPSHDTAWDIVNNEVDEAKRMKALVAAYEITATLVPVLPTAPGLSLLVYDSAHIGGVRNDGGPLGPFFDTEDWFCRAGRCP